MASTTNERITQLEARIAQLEARIAQLEARPFSVPQPIYVPSPTVVPQYPPPYPWITYSASGHQQ